MSKLLEKLAPLVPLMDLPSTPTALAATKGVLHHWSCTSVSSTHSTVELTLAESATRASEFCQDCHMQLSYAGSPLPGWFNATKPYRKLEERLLTPVAQDTPLNDLLVVNPERYAFPMHRSGTAPGASVFAPWARRLRGVMEERTDTERALLLGPRSREFVSSLVAPVLRPSGFDPLPPALGVAGALVSDAHHQLTRAYELALTSLLDDPRTVVAHLPAGRNYGHYSARLFPSRATTVYTVAPGLLVMPVALLALLPESVDHEVLAGPLPADVLEALSVLFDPTSSACADVRSTLAVARAL